MDLYLWGQTGCPFDFRNLEGTRHTQDSDQQGKRARIGSQVYYVHQVFGTPETEADDLAWLSNNVFGPSDEQTLRTFRT